MSEKYIMFAIGNVKETYTLAEKLSSCLLISSSSNAITFVFFNSPMKVVFGSAEGDL